MNLQTMIPVFLVSCISVTASAQSGGGRLETSKVAATEVIRVASDGWHFETAVTHQPFVPFGVNYYDPATFHAEPYPAYDVIGGFDAVRTDRHFAQIASLGANIVRIFLSTVSFEPDLFQLNESSFQTLDQLIALAKKHGLYVIFDLVDDWEGQPDWQSWEYYAEEQTLQGFEFLLRAFGDRYADEPTIFAWNLHNEPEVRGPDSGIMGNLFGAWVRLKYRTEDVLEAAWKDYPKSGESWEQIQPPSYEVFVDQEAAGSARFFDFQLFREDVAYNWTRRLTDALRTTDPNHMITVGLDQHSIPFKPTGTFYKPYTGFNPHKIASQVDYISMHGYNWWGEDIHAFMEGLLRYAYTGKPVVLEEFNLAELDGTTEEILRSGAGWLHWAAYASPAGWPFNLFDENEQVTLLGLAFQDIAAQLPQESLTRPEDAEVVNLDLQDVLISREAQDAAYRTYVEAAHTASAPVGFEVLHYQAPSLLHLKAPAGDAPWYVGETVQIEWETVDWDVLYEITVDLKLSRDGGTSWETIASDVASSGSYSWTIPEPRCEACMLAVADHRDSTVSSVQPFSSAFPVAVEPAGDEIPATYALTQNYPNPFNPATIIQFDLPEATFVTLKIYDITGREIASLASGRFAPGRYQYTWDAAPLVSGMYVYRLETEAYFETKVMTLHR